MEAPQKKKLAVVTGKRAAAAVTDDEESSDASMEDLCRKKFKPIAPKPVIRKDEHQAVLSTTLPVKKDAGLRKENVVLPSPKQDSSSMFVMKPGSSLPFMCGGPMIMPIPVPVVPGKDGSYVPLQVPVPIPVMVPVVVSLHQDTSLSASKVPTSVATSSKTSHHSGAEESSSSRKSGNKKGHSKQDQSPGSGSTNEGKGAKVKPCRYKYSMIKNGSLFKDLLRGVGKDFIASHGINFTLPSKDGTADSGGADKNEINTTSSATNTLEIAHKDKGAECQRQEKVIENHTQLAESQSLSHTEESHSIVTQRDSQATINSTEEVMHPTCSETASHKAASVFSSSVAQNLTPVSTASSQTTNRRRVGPTTSTVGQQTSELQVTSSRLQALSTTVSQSSSRMPQNIGCSSSTNVFGTASGQGQMNRDSTITTMSHSEARNPFQMTQSATISSSRPQILPSSMSSTCNSNNFTMASVSGSTSLMSTATAVHGNISSSTNVRSMSNSQWNYTTGSHVRTMSNPPSLDDSSLCSMDEMHSFSTEMDHSCGNLMGSSDESIFTMSHVGGSLPTSALSDSPTRRAVTAIVTPLPRSVSLTTNTSTITTVGSQVTELGSEAQRTSRQASRPPVPMDMPANQNNPASSCSVVTSTTVSQVQGWTPASNSGPPQTHLPRQENQTGSHQIAVNSQINTCHPNENVCMDQTNASQQSNQQTAEFQGQRMPVSSVPLQNKQMASVQSYTTSSQSSTAYSSALYASCPAASATSQRHLPSTTGVRFSSHNMNVHNQASASSSHFPNNSSQSNATLLSQRRSDHLLQGSQNAQGNLNERTPSSCPMQNPSHSGQINMNMIRSVTKTIPSSQTVGQNGQGIRQEMHSSGVPSTSNHQHDARPVVAQTQVTSTSYPISSSFVGSSSMRPSTRMPAFSNVATSQPIMHAGVSGGVPANTVSHGNTPVNPPWQTFWSGGSTTNQTHPSLSSGSHQQVVGSNSCGEQAGQMKQTVPARRNETSSTKAVSTSVQSVPLQSNVQALSTTREISQPCSRNDSNSGGMPAARGSHENNAFPTDPTQMPVYTSGHQRHVPANQPVSSRFSTPVSESGPRMPYPLVPPIMFGNSAPLPGMPMGGVPSVPLAGRLPSQGTSEQHTPACPVASSSQSTMQRPIAHDRHRMYVPSQFSTLHRPLYMSPGTAANTDLSLLSPHSYGQLHVHDNVLYSPRYPSSLHSLSSPGVSSSFSTSSLHREYPSTDHIDSYARTHMPHPSPHYDGSASSPLRMPHTQQSQSSVPNVSSQSIQIPPSLPPLYHSSILANREQNSLFEQNLQALLERSARRHSAMFASPHPNSRFMPCDHSFAHRMMSNSSTFSSSLPPFTSSSVSFSTPGARSRVSHAPPEHYPPSSQSQPASQIPVSRGTPLPTQSVTTGASSTSVTTVSTASTPTTSTVVTSRAVLGNMSDKYLPLELLSPESAGSPATPAVSSVSTATPQTTNDQVVKCGDMVLQCSRQVLRESGRTVLCCWFCDYHTAEPRKMRRHQKKESKPLKCQLCSFHGNSRCAVNQHYKQEHMDKDDPFRSVHA